MGYEAERVRELSKIARVALSEEEVLRLTRELGAMRELADVLLELPEEVAEADSFSDAVGLSALREDLAMGGAKTAVVGGYFTVPRTVEE